MRSKVFPRSIDSDFEIEKLGRLVISSHKIACVISPTKPKTNFISILDTKEALGFVFPMFLSVNSEEKQGENYLLNGIIYIPVPDDQTADDWDEVISNSVGFTEAITLKNDTKNRYLWVTW